MTDSRFQQWLNVLQEPELQTIRHPLLAEKQVGLRVLRTDLVHPVISGNKAYKLKYNLQAALEHQAEGILSFGGAWSNHLHALAYSCRLLNLPCVAVIRGEPELIAKSAMLQDLQQWGCQLHFVSRKAYRLRDNVQWLAALEAEYPGYYIVPEGGSSPLAGPGVAELSARLESLCRQQHWFPDQVWCAVGAGGTLAGLIAGRCLNYQLVGVPVLKNAGFLEPVIRDRLKSVLPDTESDKEWCLLLDGHFGGYAKVQPELLAQIRRFTVESRTDEGHAPLLLEPVYTGKLFCRFRQALEQNDIAPGSRVLLIHTGGLQGRRGYPALDEPVNLPF